MTSIAQYSTVSSSTVLSSTSLAGVHSSRRIAQFENHPAMPALLKELPPHKVASLFQEIGVSDATVLMAMMPTRALLLTLDESIWKSARPGLSETISVRDLIEWLEAWTEIGEEFLVEKLAAMSEDYLTTMLSRLVTVESLSRYAIYGDTVDYGDFIEGFVDLVEDGRERFGPYIVESAVDDEDVVKDLVRALWLADAPKCLRIFGRMTDLPNPDDSTRGCTPTLHDVESARESFREARGFVTADGARGFLAFAEGLTAAEIIALDEYDTETHRYLDALARSSESPDAATDDAASPVIAEDFEANDSEEGRRDSVASVSVSLAGIPNTAALRALLEESQLLPQQNALPLLPDARRLKEPVLTLKLRLLADENIESFHARARELAYLANVLRWLPIDVDPLNDNDAKSAAFAVCNLGLELAVDTRADDIENATGLIRFFLLGWNALLAIRGRVIGAFAGALSQNLQLAPWLQSEVTVGLADLRRAVESKRFADAREATIFLSIVFDSRVCRAIAPLLDAIPKFSTLLESACDSRQSRWIAAKADLQTLERLLDSLRLKSKK